MLYEIGADGIQPVNQVETDTKNDLPRGTVLELNGYSNPQYVIIKNLGVNDRFSYYGAKYLTVSLENHAQGQKDAHELKWMHEKKDNRIQTYILDEIKTEDEVLKIWEKSEVIRLHTEQVQKHANEVKEVQISKGQELYKQHIPEGTKAFIIAEKHINKSDLQTDYFAHSIEETVILGYSKHTRDLFSEMRKHAARIPETAHLEKDKYEIYPTIDKDINTNGRYYHKGERSHWHQEETPTEFFNSEEEAQEYINAHPLENILFEGESMPFKWEISKRETEHREKYSMGAGFYLKDGHSDSTGWCISKSKIYGDRKEQFYLSLGKRCIFTEKQEV